VRLRKILAGRIFGGLSALHHIGRANVAPEDIFAKMKANFN
jgi:hypothetical protein